MFTIREKQELSSQCKLLVVEAPLIAAKAKAGHFVILRVDETGERIPLTIANSNPQQGTITIIFQEVGKTTAKLGKLNVGEAIQDVVGPLGKPINIENYGTVVCIGGGIGVAPIYPVIKALKKQGNHVITIIGARCQELLILEDWVEAVSDELIVTSDDGSCGRAGLVTDPLKEMIDEGVSINLVIAIGPLVMMEAVCRVTREHNIKTIVSLNPIMVDGSGMCGCCRVSVGGETRFACVDGPEFDGHQVDFQELKQRQQMYLTEERESYKHYLACSK